MSEAIEAIAEEIEDQASSLADIERSVEAARVVFARSAAPFAVVDPDGFEFKLGTTIAGAALRTPDVTAASRGAEWVRFEPAALDPYALDRAVAWFEAAWRLAEPG